MMLPKANIVRDRDWLDHLRDEPCILTGQKGSAQETVDPAHIGTLGKSIKSSDDEALPLLHRYHAEGHQIGEMTMFRRYLPTDVLRAALRAYARELYREWKQRKSEAA